MKADYLTRSKNQHKAALILLGGGAALIATSFVIPRGDLVHDGICIGAYCSDKYKNDGIKTGFFVAGAVAALSSIPFFIASKKNKRRAAISFKLERSILPGRQDMISVLYPALRARVSF